MHLSSLLNRLRNIFLLFFSAKTEKCPSNKFDCYNNGSVCIEPTKLCDTRMDCDNYADEENSLCESKNIFYNLLKTLVDTSFLLTLMYHLEKKKKSYIILNVGKGTKPCAFIFIVIKLCTSVFHSIVC